MRIVVTTYLVRYPLGGMMSWQLQWISGLAKLGHDVFVLERATELSSCFDPSTSTMGDDPSTGLREAERIMEQLGLSNRIVFVDSDGVTYPAGAPLFEEVFAGTDLLIDLGNHGAWLEEATAYRVRAVTVDGEPLYTQAKRLLREADGQRPPCFDAYFTNGAHIGTERSDVPTCGLNWHHVFNPVNTDLYPFTPGEPLASFTTVMNWQSHRGLSFEGRVYGQKDVEFARFVRLPTFNGAGPLEVAVGGKVPREELADNGWDVLDAHRVAGSYEQFGSYIRSSAGEFAVCKEGYVSARTGWFSDRSAAYLATGRPVVMQDTGLEGVLPLGRGLFAVDTVDEAAEAIRTIRGDYDRQSRWAREIAEEYLSTDRVLPRFLEEAFA